jgi:hypothetical protein
MKCSTEITIRYQTFSFCPAFDDGMNQNSGTIYRAALIDFIEELPYIDFVEKLEITSAIHNWGYGHCLITCICAYIRVCT